MQLGKNMGLVKFIDDSSSLELIIMLLGGQLVYN